MIFIFGYFCDWSKAARGLCSAWNVEKQKGKDRDMRLKPAKNQVKIGKSLQSALSSTFYLSFDVSGSNLKKPSATLHWIYLAFKLIKSATLDLSSFQVNQGERLSWSLQAMQLIIRAPESSSFQDF